MKHSIRYRMMLLFTGLMAAMLFAIWIINNFWLEGYYTSQQLKVMEDAYEKLNTTVMEKVQSGESIGEVITRETRQEWELWQERLLQDAQEGLEPGKGKRKDPEYLPDESSLLYAVREYGEKNNIAIVLIDSNTGKALVSSARDEDWMVRKAQQYILGKDNLDSEVLADNENYTVEKTYDFRAKSHYMESWGFFSDDSTMFIMSMPLASIQESAALSNRFTTYVGLIVLVLGGILMYFATRKVTDPIMKLAALSERMSRLDFDASYEGDAVDEVGVLGRSMNMLSEKLKETIGELQKDIEEKTQVDEMRKDFIANVSHELKTPIALIQGYAEGLSEGMCEDEESRNYYCEVITDEAAKMNKMVKQLLTLTALEFGKDTPAMEVFDITELIGEWLSSARLLIEQNDANIEYEPGDPLWVRADEFKIEEVISNYLSNAMNHLDGARIIRVRTEQIENQVKVSVFNTGTPIPEEDIPNLWTKFFKVDKARTRAYGGSGIGLSIVKAILDAHGQQCGVENKADGVEFWFTLEAENFHKGVDKDIKSD